MAQLIDKLTLRDMIENPHLYSGLADGLIQLPLPEQFMIGRKRLPIPKDLGEFTTTICYGQRIFLAQKEDNDFGIILRMIDGYYYPLAVDKWDADKSLLFGKKVITLPVKYLFTVAMHLIILVGEMIEREQKLLYREPSKLEKAAGIDKLNVFSDLTSLDFLRDAMKCTVPEVLLTPYNECLVRFMIACETSKYQDRYYELMRADAQPKNKFR